MHTTEISVQIHENEVFPATTYWANSSWRPFVIGVAINAMVMLGHASLAAAAEPDRVMPLASVSSSSTTTPTFSWQAVPEATYYLLRVTDWTNTSIDRWYTPTDAGCSTGGGTCSVTLLVPQPPGPLTWQVLAWSPAGYGPWSDPITFAIEVADPLATAPQPISPSGTLSSYSATYAWTPVSSAAFYRLAMSVNGGPETDSWLSPASLGCVGAAAPCAIELTTLASGSAAWRVQAWTVNGASNWSTPMMVSFAVFPSPSAPQAISPTGSATASPTFTWTAPDNVVYYYLLVDDATGNRVDQWLTPGQAGCLIGGATCTFAPAVVLEPGSARWRVLAWNPSGYSPFSSTFAFTVASGGVPLPTQMPGRVTPLGPRGSVSGTPTFTWRAQPKATFYLVRLTDWTDTYIDRWYTPADAACPSGNGVCSASFVVTVRPGPTAWNVIAWSPAGYSPWSETVDVIVDKVDPAASAPQSIAPSGLLWAHAAAFKWTAVPNAALYRLSMSIDGAPAADSWYTPAVLGCVSSALCTMEETITTNESVRWKVQAWTVTGRGNWSAPMSVSVGIFPTPRAPVAMSPAGVTGASPMFTWMASEHVAYYFVRIEDVKGDLIEKWMTPAQAGCADGTGACAFTVTDALHPGRANWRVLAWNPSGRSAWSLTLPFQVQGRAGKEKEK